MSESGDAQRLEAVPQERRLHPRYTVDEDSTVMLVDCGLPLKAHIVDLGMTGCRVRTIEQFTGDAGRALEICFKVRGVAFRCRGVVRWRQGNHLLGIHFQNLIPRRQSELAEVIEELAAAQAAGTLAADHPAPETPSAALPTLTPATPGCSPRALPTAKVIDPSPDNPRKLESVHQQPVLPAAEAIPPSAADPLAAQANTQPSGTPALIRPHRSRERRAQARHQVDTSATILLVRVGSALRGRILDLSLGGCRIRTDDRFLVGIYTRVEAEFRFQGLPFRLSGVIQAIHNQNTVGIRFLDLSERKREQILELIGEIETMRATDPPDDAPTADRQDPSAAR